MCRVRRTDTQTQPRGTKGDYHSWHRSGSYLLLPTSLASRCVCPLQRSLGPHLLGARSTADQRKEES